MTYHNDNTIYGHIYLLSVGYNNSHRIYFETTSSIEKVQLLRQMIPNVDITRTKNSVDKKY